MSWHPPIPAEAVYRDEVASLGAGLRLLLYCYNCIQKDGTIEVSLDGAADSLKVSYRTVKDWWKLLKDGPFFCEQIDRGKRGWVVRMADEWIDWHVMRNNYPSSQFSEGQKSALDKEKEQPSRPDEGRNSALENLQGPMKARSRPDEGRNSALEGSAYKEDQHDHESESSQRDSRAPPSPHQQLMRLYTEHLGYKLTSGPQEAAAAKKILAAGYTPEQAIEVYQVLKSDQFWQAKHLSLQTVYKQLGAVLAPKGQTNGQAPRNSGRKQQYTPPRPEWSGWTETDLDKPL